MDDNLSNEAYSSDENGYEDNYVDIDGNQDSNYLPVGDS
jgi:hypothetical protein